MLSKPLACDSPPISMRVAERCSLHSYFASDKTGKTKEKMYCGHPRLPVPRTGCRQRAAALCTPASLHVYAGLRLPTPGFWDRVVSVEALTTRSVVLRNPVSRAQLLKRRRRKKCNGSIGKLLPLHRGKETTRKVMTDITVSYWGLSGVVKGDRSLSGARFQRN